MDLYSDMIKSETELSRMVLEARMMVLEMEFELKKYELRRGRDEKYEETSERVKKIWSALSIACSIDDERYINRLRYEQSERENILLKQKIASLEHQIEASARAFEGL